MMLSGFLYFLSRREQEWMNYSYEYTPTSFDTDDLCSATESVSRHCFPDFQCNSYHARHCHFLVPLVNYCHGGTLTSMTAWPKSLRVA